MFLPLAGCCASYATRGCLTPEELRGLEAKKLAPYLHDQRSWVREESAKALGVAHASDARGDLESLLKDPHERPWVRAAAAEALGRLGDASAAPVLIGAAQDAATAPEVKIALILALCRLPGTTDALQAIAPLAADEDLLVSAVAEASVASKCQGRRP